MKKVAVVGLGSIAERHRRNLRKLFPYAEIYALSASGRRPLHTPADSDYVLKSVNDVIDESVDLAIVASPASCHVSHSVELIKAGIPTLIEKPLSDNLAEAKKLLGVHKMHTTPVAVGYCIRYMPSAIQVKKLIDSSAVGEIYNVFVDAGQFLPDWRPEKHFKDSVSANKKLGGGVLLELSHEFDYIQWLLGSLTTEYSNLRSTDELDLEVEDIADVCLKASSGALVNIHLDFLQKRPYRKCSIVGSKGRIDWCLINNEVIFYDKSKSYSVYKKTDWDKNQMYIDMICDFVSKIKLESNDYVDIESALHTIELIEQIKNFSKRA